MTIHQPSSRLFHMFDRLLVLSEGRPVFSGQARDAMEYFCSRGFIPSIPMNPADFVLDLATGDISMISTPLEPSITMGNQTAKEIQQMVIEVGLLFYLVLYWASTGLFGGVFVFPTERELLAKGRSSNMYRLSAYYMSSTLCDTVAQIFYATIFYCIVYFMANFQRTASAFLLTLLGLYLVIFTAHGTGELIGAAVPDIRRTGLVASIVLLVFMITGGFYIQHMPVFIRWLKYLSFVFYGFRFVVKMQYSPHQIYDCTGPGGCKSIQSSPSFETMGLDGGMQEVWILILTALAYRIVAYFYLNKIKLL